MERGKKVLDITIAGQAAPAGSKTADPVMRKGPLGPEPVLDQRGRPVVRQRHANKNTRPWMDRVAGEARVAWGRQPLLDGAVWIEILCLEPRPSSHYRTGKFSHLLKPGAPAYPHRTSTGDSDKLRRAVQDALSGVVWVDDKLVVSGGDAKDYGEHACCIIQVGLMVEQTAADRGLAEIPQINPVGQETLIAA